MEMNPETIRALLDAFDDSDWREMTVTVGSDRLHVSRDASTGGAGAPAAAPPASAAPAPAPAVEPPASDAPAPIADGAPPATTAAAPAQDAPAPAGTPSGTPVESPSVGLFWRSPSPGEPPFVEVGSRVEAGDTLGIVEVMKLMNHLVAPVAGVVTAILVENGAAVEFGQTIVTIDPEG